MLRTHRILAPVMLLAALALAGNAWATRVTDPDYPRSLEQDGPVSVEWSDPAGFSEVRYSRDRFEATRGDWVRAIAKHLAKRAGAALAPGERLEVTITDIERAGEYEPAGINRVRIVREIYPPRIELRYTLYNAAGEAVDSGERALTDLGFLNRSTGRVWTGDPLRFEKRLLDDWIREDIANRTS